VFANACQDFNALHVRLYMKTLLLPYSVFFGVKGPPRAWKLCLGTTPYNFPSSSCVRVGDYRGGSLSLHECLYVFPDLAGLRKLTFHGVIRFLDMTYMTLICIEDYPALL
jgi:hypothetical protein